jgi:pyrimidine operon attenuation protein/uracil phosphoribosyltransferase
MAVSETSVFTRRVVMDSARVHGAIDTMAQRLRGLASGKANPAFVGIRRRGVPLAARLLAAAPEFEHAPLGQLDITLYRDDLSSLGPQPIVGPTDLPFGVDARTVVLVDDVLFTGRTVRAALDALLAFARRSTRCWPSAARAPSSWRCSSTAVTANTRFSRTSAVWRSRPSATRWSR